MGESAFCAHAASGRHLNCSHTEQYAALLFAALSCLNTKSIFREFIHVQKGILCVSVVKKRFY